MNQLAIQFQAHSPTSREAARRIAGGTHSLRMQVLAHLRKYPEGLTDEEMQLGIPMAQNTQRPRRIELVRMGLIRDSGDQRLTSSDRFATVWIAVEERCQSL